MVDLGSVKEKYRRLFIGYESCSRKNVPFEESTIWIAEIN